MCAALLTAAYYAAASIGKLQALKTISKHKTSWDERKQNKNNNNMPQK